MYRALYDYKTDVKKYLSFQTGDQFTVLDTSQQDWYLAQNGFGEVGYIPKNYVVKDVVELAEILKSIDRALEMIHYEASSKGGQYTHIQRENLKKLTEHRQNVLHNSQAGHQEAVQPKRQSVKRSAPPPPTSVNEIKTQEGGQLLNTDVSARVTEHEHKEQTSKSTKHSTSSHFASTCQNLETVKDNLDMNVKSAVDSIDTASSPIPSPSKLKTDGILCGGGRVVDENVEISGHLGSTLIEEVRKSTGISYKKSCVAVETVLRMISEHVPEIASVINRIYKTTEESVVKASVSVEEASSDYERLCELFSQLTACKDDSQQRSWALHEDEGTISTCLLDMLSILENAKTSVSLRALASDSYENIHHLVQYYQMETRLKLRLLLLQVFGAMCTLDKKGPVITLLLCSVLTTELAKELQLNIEDCQRSSYVALLLSMIFSTGEPVPASLHDHLNAEFVQFLFNNIENPASGEHEDQLSDLVVNLVLAFNLHFYVPSKNLVLQVMEERKTVKVFSEKILLLFNRDEDPVRLSEDSSSPCNSVMKMLQDMYSQPATSCILYTNDAKVLIDIILRHVIDLSPGDQNRSAHLKLMRLYLENADYSETRHRYSELKECLHRIHTEETEMEDDKHTVEYIFRKLNMFND
ncbi:NCK-interacting protein with SH3 domain-like [Dreissena polymorpha]|uniref:SH3 domain-containing protein n=1 Tax=Dreissena polymorpha TaxID=45954 RepID=A0A9D4C617_DREPO|nr:NCK-interacting protein with SH3 domain-like [Dreissena polymorpha]KAH3717720.1 hypothetical protein DPMN_060515 [Dreissena polymorpha]